MSDNSIQAVLRRRDNDLLGDGYNIEFRRAITRAADHIDQLEAALATERVQRAAIEKDRDDLREEEQTSECLRIRLTDILDAVTLALKGEPPALTRYSWHDLGDLAKSVVSERYLLRAALNRVVTECGFISPEQMIRIAKEALEPKT